MSLHKLARELDETARQSESMVEAITYALETLSDPAAEGDAARREAVAMIITAIQAQDRIAQRCRNMAAATRRIAALPKTATAADYDEIWSSLELDELRVPALSGIAVAPSNGDVDLF